MWSASKYDVLSGNAPDAWATITFAFPVRYFDCMVWDNAIEIQLIYPGALAGDAREIDPINMSLPFPIQFQTLSINVRNKVAGAVGRYEFVGFA